MENNLKRFNVIFPDTRTLEEIKEQKDAPPCLGETVCYGADGNEFECGYEVEFSCDDCLCNGGYLDPRISVTGIIEEDE